MPITIPIFRSVDVLVVGAGCGAVEAALAAASENVSVLCVTAATYPGEDVAATLRYWPDRQFTGTSLTKQLFDTGTSLPPSPMHLKRTLERALIDARVDYLYMTYPAFLLRDNQGVVCGLVVANRSGFQAIIAKVIIDTTSRAIVGRMTGATFLPWPASTIRFHRVVVGGTPLDKLECRRMHTDVDIEGIAYPAYEYVLPIDVPDSSPGAFAGAEVTARLQTWHPKMMLGSDRLYFVSPDRLVSPGNHLSALPSGHDFDITAFRCNQDPVFILSDCADIGDDAATALSNPGESMRIGARLGVAAADSARLRKTIVFGAVDYRMVPSVPEGIEVCRKDRYFRLEDAAQIELDLAHLPVFGRFDVAVSGGGTAGAPAAIGAARQGQSVLMAEYLGGLGGVGTEGRIARYYHGNRVGFTAEMDVGVFDLGPECEFGLGNAGWNTEWKKQWYLREAQKAGAQVWFGSLGVAAACRGTAVCGIALATPYAPVGLVLAHAVVDSTGNADVAAAAGAETVVISRAHIAVQGTGLSPFTPGKHYTNTDHTFVDDTDVLDATRAFTLAREKFRTCFDLAQIIDSRQRRQVRGDVELDALDFLANRRFPDTVVIAKSNFDSHGFTIHPVFIAKAPDKLSHDACVPFRALLPRGIEGVLVTGLGISAHRDALPVIRMQPDVQNQGYAAGVAAAMAAAAKVSLRSLDIRALQRHLVETGVLPSNVLAETDSFPIDDKAIAGAVQHDIETHRGLAIIFAQPGKSLPLLRQAYAGATDARLRLRYALVLGLLRDDTGLDTLIDAVGEQPWDTGWHFRGMNQFGFSLSPLDSLLIALARTGSSRALPPMMRKLETLGPDREFSHFRALTIAFEAMPSAGATPLFAAFLDYEANRGSARESIAAALENVPDDPIDTTERNRELRELLIARGLFACGDFQGKAAAVLESYKHDLHGHYARHARAILNRDTADEGTA